MIKDLILNNRSYRRFYQDEIIEPTILRCLIDLARLSGSAANRQPLKYIISCTKEKNALIFENISWAGYLKDWDGPLEGERPSAYIIILGDKGISSSFGCDHGIAAQSILLGAVEIGLGGCMIGTINRANLSERLEISPCYDILLVLALGKPKEKVVIEALNTDHDIKYWRDKEEVHHVPKRALDEIIIS
jgi:nitroreductase